ncbi:unnamed protein product [Phytophthora lilii]|uniref:Unnamed protein product n=1 Tax=Phytophthora lilii TaxID=2077276 RepID=A0A9W6THH3_9STRA|nr:unnamed protein product [Phytophthora lilii]
MMPNLIHLLSKEELEAVTNAFNRSRGHCHGLDFDRFKETLLHEAFVAIPDVLAQRLFRTWNISGSGELSFAEFNKGITLAAKGSRGEHLKMVFQMMKSTSCNQTVTRSDVLQFLHCVAFHHGPMATQSWGADELLHRLFGSSQTATLTMEKFVAVVGSNTTCARELVGWIPSISNRLLKVSAVGMFIDTTSQPLIGFEALETRDILSPKQTEDVRFELRSILFALASASPALTVGVVADRFLKAVANDSLIKTICHVWQLHSTEASGSEPRLKTFTTDDAREELKLFVLGLCCALASNPHQCYRMLFELFDEYNCGQIDVEQLGLFLQLTTGCSPLDSEREATIAIKRRGSIHSPLPSPPASPSNSSAPNTNPQVINLSNFVEVAQQQPGLSLSEVETAMMPFHFKRFSLQDKCQMLATATARHGNISLSHLLGSYFSQHKLDSDAFCLLSPNEWQKLLNEMQTNQSIMSTYTDIQVMCEEATELPSGNVLIPLPSWLLILYWHERQTRIRQLQHQSQYTPNWASNVQLHQDEETTLHGFWVRISVNLTSRDGFDRAAIFPQVIAFEQCTFQNVIDAVLFHKKWCEQSENASSRVTTMSHCQVHMGKQNTAGEIKTMIQQDELAVLSQDELGISLGSTLSSLCPSRALGNAVGYDILSFELRFSVVEVHHEEPSEKEDVSGKFELENPQCLFQSTSELPDAIPCGLTNLGNTCFMNAVLQCLTATPLLQEYFYREKLRQKQLSSRTIRTSPTQQVSKSLSEDFQELLAGIYQAGAGAVDSPKILLNSFSALSPHMADGNQQDAQEFLVCLLGHLSNELKRKPKHSSELLILSPRSHSLLANLFKTKSSGSEESGSTQQVCLKDSNGRHDRLVATEWWVSYLVNEPSIANILFSGQFKSTFICGRCKHESARFELLSSLQLSLVNDNTLYPPTDQQEVVIIVHTATARCPLRTVVQIYEYSTVSDVLVHLSSSQIKSNFGKYVIGGLGEFAIRNLMLGESNEDDKTPASVLPNPVHAFEVFEISCSGDDTAGPSTGSSQLYLRFVHRRTFLVPFYFSTPTRNALCGSPFVCSSKVGALTGPALYQMVYQRFLLGRRDAFRSTPQSSAYHYAPPFVLRRVRDDGCACSRCHWSSGCTGCLIPMSATAAELLDLENCETIAIEWDLQLHPQDPSAFWWLQSYPTRDHSSYIHYRRTKTHSLKQCLLSLCSTEHLDASCSHCQESPTTLTPHIKQLSLWSLPPILVLQLKRFHLSTTNGNYEWKKLTHSVDFPIDGLDLSEFLAPVDGAHNDSDSCTDRCSTDTLDPRVRRGIEYLLNDLNIPLSSASRSCTKYDLYAVVNHSGHGINSGHYTAQFRRPNETRWWLADDAIVTPLRVDELSPSSTAYLLFYVRQDVATGATELSDLFPSGDVTL